MPGNPDISLMALALAAGADGVSEICHCSRQAEVEAFLSVLSGLGLTAKRNGEEVKLVGGPLRPPDGPLDAGRSELLFACLTGLLAGAPFKTQVEADLANPGAAEGVLESLSALGARLARAEGDRLAVEIDGRKLKAGQYRTQEPNTAVKCAMFLAGLTVDGKVELLQEGAGDDDLEWLFRAADVRLEKARSAEADAYALTLDGPAAVRPALHDLPGCPDAALFLLMSAAMQPRSDLTLNGVGNDWKTRRALELLRRMNAQIDIQVVRSASKFPIRRVRVVGSELRRTKISGAQAALFLHELPFLAVAGACAAGETIIRDAQALRGGPVDCLAIVSENLRKMQVRVGEMPDGLVIQGGRPLQGARVDAGGDPRVGMAFALAGLVAEGPTVVVNSGDIEREFPGVSECLVSVSQQKGG